VSVEEVLSQADPSHAPVFRRAAPAREKRPAPSSTEWKLLCRVAAYPSLAGEIDAALMDPALEESRTLGEVAEYSRGLGEGRLSDALLIDKFKDTPHERLLFEAQAFALNLKESEDESRTYVRHTVRSLEVLRKREQLRAYEQRLARGQLSKDEHRHYADMISEVKALEQRLQAEARSQAK